MINVLATVNQGHINGHLLLVVLKLNFNQWICPEVGSDTTSIQNFDDASNTMSELVNNVCAVGDPYTLAAEQYYKPTTLYSQTRMNQQINVFHAKLPLTLSLKL